MVWASNNGEELLRRNSLRADPCCVSSFLQGVLRDRFAVLNFSLAIIRRLGNKDLEADLWLSVRNSKSFVIFCRDLLVIRKTVIFSDSKWRKRDAAAPI